MAYEINQKYKHNLNNIHNLIRDLNKYTDYSDEISPNELFDGLMGYGLFAEKIPSFLTSAGFLTYTKTLSLPLKLKAKDYIRYSWILRFE